MIDLATLRERVVARARPHLPAAAGDPQVSPRFWEIRNAAGDDGEPAVLRIYDEIHWLFGVSAEQFAEDLASITARDIRVEINSPGGDVFDGIAIYNALRAHPARVTTRVDGLAASAASVIVQAGDRRVVMSSAQLMIHEAWGMAVGPANEIREFADLLDKMNGVIASLYAARGTKDADEFRSMMTTDTWLTDAEALELGLVDEIADPKPQASAAADAGSIGRPTGVTAGAGDAGGDRTITLMWDDLVVPPCAGGHVSQFLAGTGGNLPTSAADAAPAAADDGPPPAGQREDTPPDPGAASAGLVDQEQAARLLAELTLNKE